VVRAAEPTGLQRALGVERRVWLGDLAATPQERPVAETTLERACSRYVDHFALDRLGGG
jgi:hypothetical protein